MDDLAGFGGGRVRRGRASVHGELAARGSWRRGGIDLAQAETGVVTAAGLRAAADAAGEEASARDGPHPADDEEARRAFVGVGPRNLARSGERQLVAAVLAPDAQQRARLPPLGAVRLVPPASAQAQAWQEAVVVVPGDEQMGEFVPQRPVGLAGKRAQAGV